MKLIALGEVSFSVLCDCGFEVRGRLYMKWMECKHCQKAIDVMRLIKLSHVEDNEKLYNKPKETNAEKGKRILDALKRKM